MLIEFARNSEEKTIDECVREHIFYAVDISVYLTARDYIAETIVITTWDSIRQLVQSKLSEYEFIKK